jgi:hypothetical protein
MTAEPLSSTCDARYVLGGLCGAEAVEHAVVGCVHEHVKQIGSCEQHALGEDFGADCWECWDGRDSHLCPLAVRPVREVTR